jgi:acyl-CoA synthetase (AMP-forming)/AMP-acid ligase II
MTSLRDELPFTPTGKIQRHVLVCRVLERRGAAGAGS